MSDAAGDGLAPGAESVPRTNGALGGNEPGGVVMLVTEGATVAPVVIEHVHLSNIRIKLTACGWLAAGSPPPSHAAAYAGR